MWGAATFFVGRCSFIAWLRIRKPQKAYGDVLLTFCSSLIKIAYTTILQTMRGGEEREQQERVYKKKQHANVGVAFLQKYHKRGC